MLGERRLSWNCQKYQSAHRSHSELIRSAVRRATCGGAARTHHVTPIKPDVRAARKCPQTGLHSRMVQTGSYSEMGPEKFSNPAKSGYNKGTIRSDIRYRGVSKDVRRHRLISIDYIKTLPVTAEVASSSLVVPAILSKGVIGRDTENCNPQLLIHRGTHPHRVQEFALRGPCFIAVFLCV
jgi:hypothetical protein